MKIFNPKTCSILLVIAMLLCFAMPVYAVETDATEPVDEEYKVSIAKYGDSTIRVGGSFYLAVTANKYFNATEILIEYDKEKLSFVQLAIGEENASGTDTVNGVKLIDYGSHDKTPVYLLEFSVLESVEATHDTPNSVTFEVLEAGFGTIASAADQNLIPAVLPDALTLEVRPALVAVNFDANEYYSNVTSIEKGEDLVFYPERTTGAYYDYDLPVVKVNGQEVTVTPTQDGGWLIENAAGAVHIQPAVRTPKEFGDVTYNDVQGQPVLSGTTEKATYLQDVSFTIPADLDPPETESGYSFAVTAKVAGQNYTLSRPAVDADGNRTYTIPGADVKGAVEVSVTRTDLDPTKYTVSIGGNANSDGMFAGATGAGASVQVGKDGTASVTLNVSVDEGLNKGYHYVVKVDGQKVDLDENGQVKIENIDGNTHVEIEKTLNVDDVTNVVRVGEEDKNYLTMNGQNMWLIQLPNHVQNTETANYKYAGQEMFWSADHNNFVCVVISVDAPSIDVSQFELVSVTATQTIASDNWDVNKSGDLDASDAQLIWNMYNDQYNGFSDSVTAEKFVLADANHDGILDTKDASVIINQIRASLVTE